MEAIRDFLKVEDNTIKYTLPNGFNCDEVEIIIMPKPIASNNEDMKRWKYWNDEEIDNFGKIGIGLSNHDYDDEDYTKW